MEQYKLGIIGNCTSGALVTEDCNIESIDKNQMRNAGWIRE